ncbi:MAG: transcriptional regulator [Deltaproteobacteria bacterium]|nr:transcriptional regulator [Deltaproteobacteria bacterium]MBW2351465.1 transcriptional regulator [Deltaproteobacteria bacterium]
MTEADIVLTPPPQADGIVKNRPALLLRQLPPFGDFLACGISTQLHHAVPEFDDVISMSDSDFPASGLVADSVIRLGFLAVLPSKRILGSIGKIASERHARLLRNLGEHLMANLKETPNQAIDADT